MLLWFLFFIDNLIIMAELHVQKKRNRTWWLWLLVILIVCAVVYYFLVRNNVIQDPTGIVPQTSFIVENNEVQFIS